MRKRTGLALLACGVVAGMIAVPVLAAGGADKLMKMTMHMTMDMGANMPAMPPRTMEREVCMPHGRFDPEAMQRTMSSGSHGMCHMEHFAQHGEHISYDMVCNASSMVVNSHAEVELQGENAYAGKVHSTMTGMGRAMKTDMDFTATRIGSCTYTPPPAS